MCTHIRGVRKRYLLSFAEQIDRINNQWNPVMVSILMFIPLALTKVKTARDTILQGFLITIYLVITDN